MRNLLLTATFAILLVGCVAKEKVVQIKEYMPPYAAKQSLDVKKSSDKVVKIKATSAQKNYLSNEMWYKKELENSSYAYSRWAQPPNALISRVIEGAVEDSMTFKSVVGLYSTASSDFIVESALIDFYQDFVTDSSEAVMVVKVSLVSSSNGKVVASKKFEYRQKCKTNDVSGGVQSFGEILGRFSADVAVWVRSVL